MNVAFIVAFAGFLRAGEFTYTAKDLADPYFTQSHLTRSDITFAADNQHVILRLKFSKTDYDHSGVEITLAATNSETCPVRALSDLYELDPQPPHAPLFRLNHSHAFSKQALIDTLRLRLRQVGISDQGYSGHSFRKGAAQHAVDNGLSDALVQQLGRWSSDAFKLYFKRSTRDNYHLSLRYQLGLAPSF